MLGKQAAHPSEVYLVVFDDLGIYVVPLTKRFYILFDLSLGRLADTQIFARTLQLFLELLLLRVDSATRSGHQEKAAKQGKLNDSEHHAPHYTG